MATTRQTTQRQAVAEALEGAEGPLSAGEILDIARESVPGIGLATVYRHLKNLSDVEALEVPGRGTVYEPAGREHHHHFHCDSCDRVFDVAGCFSDIEKNLPEKFRAVRHELTFYGRCADCASD